MVEQLRPLSTEDAFTSPVSPLSSEVSSSGIKQPAIEYGNFPRPEHRSFSEQARHTAGHELNHALVALDYGIMPVSLSVVPEGNSLGRTIFAGEIDTENFKVIAAGGAVDTTFGKASGFGSSVHPGSDFYHIHELQMHYGGIGAQEAVLRASKSINTVSASVREKASEIIASLGHISGDDIPKIIRIAELEVRHGIHAAPQLEETVERIKKTPAYRETLSSGKHTIIGIDTHGNTQDPRIIELEEIVCQSCGGKESHSPLCRRENDQLTNAEPLPRSGTIVDLSAPKITFSA